MYQLLKLPVLFHHYLEHSKEEGSRSFADFLHDHYSAEDSYPSPGNDEHGKLPFKSHDCGMANGFFAYYAAEAFMVKAEIPFSAKEEVFVYDVAFNSSSHLAKIWQPPKSC